MSDQGVLHVMRTAGGLTHRNALRKKVTAIRIERLAFLDDHGLLTNKAGRDADWRSGGTRYVELEGGAHWKPGEGKSFPASITKATTIRIEIDLAVEAFDADAVDCVLTAKPSGGAEGAEPETFLTFRARLDIAGGQAPSQKIVMTAQAAIPDQVFLCSARTLTWEAQVAGKTFALGTTGPHTIYVTYGRPDPGGAPMPTPFGSEPAPLEDGITEKRMEAAINKTEMCWRTSAGKTDPNTGEYWDRNDPHLLARCLMDTVLGYTLKTDPRVPPEFCHPSYFNANPPKAQTGAWPICDYADELAECQAIVRYVRGILMQIGCPGRVELVVIYALANDGGKKALEDRVLPPDADPKKYQTTKQGPQLLVGLHRGFPCPHNGASQRLGLADHDVSVGQLIEPGEILNSFEACLKFTCGGSSRYYGGGVPGSNCQTPEEVLKVFRMLVWTTDLTGSESRHPQVITEVVRMYQGQES